MIGRSSVNIILVVINKKSNLPNYVGENEIVENGEDKKVKLPVIYQENGVVGQIQYQRCFKWTIEEYKRVSRRIKKGRFKKYHFIAGRYKYL